MRRIFTLTLLLGLVLCSHTPAFAAGLAHQQSVKQRAGAPQISILSPKNGTTVADTTIIVEVLLLNFKPVPSKVPASEFGQHPEANNPNEGHIQLLLDGGPVVTLDQGTSYTFMNVPPGRHRLKAYLVNNDHSALIPAVERQVDFTTVTAATRSSSPAKPAMSRLPRTTEPDGFLSSEIMIIVLLVMLMTMLIGGLTTQSYSRVALFNAEVNAQIDSLQHIASARTRDSAREHMKPK